MSHLDIQNEADSRMRGLLSNARFEKKHKVYAERGGAVFTPGFVSYQGMVANDRGIPILLFPSINNKNRSRSPESMSSSKASLIVGKRILIASSNTSTNHRTIYDT
jgi:hypothetical protein